MKITMTTTVDIFKLFSLFPRFVIHDMCRMNSCLKKIGIVIIDTTSLDIMKEALNHLRSFNFLSIFFGSGIFVYSLSLKVINYIRLFMVVSCGIVSTVGSFQKSWSSNEFWMALTFFVYFPSTVIYPLVIHFHRDDLATMLDTFFKGMKHRDRVFMRRLSNVFTVLITLHSVLWISSFVFFGQESILDKVFFVFSSFEIDIHPHACCLYILLCVSSYFCLQKSLQQIKENLASDSYDIRHLVLTLTSIQTNVKKVNSVSGVPLLLLFFYVYIAVPSTYFFIQSAGPSTLAWFTMELVTIVLHVVTVVIMVVLVERLNAKLEKTREQIKDLMIRQKKLRCSQQVHQFLSLLDDRSLFTMTAMDLFNMDYNMFICFAASVVSFSTLLFQINSSLNAPETVTMKDIRDLIQTIVNNSTKQAY